MAQISLKSSDYEWVDPDIRLKEIFGNDFIGSTIREGKLIEIRLKKSPDPTKLSTANTEFKTDLKE